MCISIYIGWYLSNNKENDELVKNINIVEENTIKSSIDKVYDSVVAIDSYSINGENSLGSGFIYKVDDKYGYILTNYHVIKDSDSINVINTNGKEDVAKILGYDEMMDIAVLGVNKDYVTLLAPISFNNALNIGDTVFTIGSPSGIEYIGTVTKGIISGVNREIKIYNGSNEYIMNVIQTDAAINPGNSGGPLVNINGEVIGINSLKLVKDEIEGMGFAIPIEEVLLYTDRLEKGVLIKRPYLGFDLINNNDGVKIININIDSVKSDLKLNDIIVEFNDIVVKDIIHFRYLLYKCSIGDKVKIDYIRDNKKYYTYIDLNK